MIFVFALFALLLLFELWKGNLKDKIVFKIKQNGAFMLGLFILGIIVFLIYMHERRSSWYDKLSGKYGVCSVAHIYKEQTIDAANYYDYIYKVGSNYYTSSVTGSNVGISNTKPIESFLVVYDLRDPTIHIVIWESKFPTLTPLGTILDTISEKERKVEEHTTDLMNGLSPKADMNDAHEIKSYLEKYQLAKTLK